MSRFSANADEKLNSACEKFLEARQNEKSKDEFNIQQELYSGLGADYDVMVPCDEYRGPDILAEKLNAFYPDDKNITILDYGCGTGLVADRLVKYGFKNIDGLDANKSLLEVAARRGNMKNLILGNSEEGHTDIKSASYDLICSCGVFFVTPTHPGYECIEELCRLIKKGGYLIILCNDQFRSNPYAKFEIVESLEKKGVLKIHPIEICPGYRRGLEFEEESVKNGALMKFEIL